MMNREYGIGILGVGKWVPEKLLSNDDVEKMAGMESGEIEKKTGVKTRYICRDDDTASGMSILPRLRIVSGTAVVVRCSRLS